VKIKIASRIADLFNRKIVPGRGRAVRSRYDAAGTSVDSQKHWAFADGSSADAEANAGIRQTLRNRARYEVANNSYAKGIVLTIANNTIGTGPRLQCLTDDETVNSKVEEDFCQWAQTVDLAGKLRTVRQVRCVDGEAFILLVQNPKLKDANVRLDLQLVEADCVTSQEYSVDPLDIDGIKFDEYGNPQSYRVLLYHPGGDKNFDITDARIVPAENVIHYFRIDRPGQHRGVPEITPALPLFAQLRRFTLAVLAAAESAADFAGIIYTDSPAGGESEDIAALDPIQLERNMLLTMPSGWKMGQLDSKQPCSTYGEFKNQILNEIARCLNIPFNLAAGNSNGCNYASGRLDQQMYHKAITVERANIVTRILNRIFEVWYKEYALSTGFASEVPYHTWFWDGFEHVDPSKEASATAIRLGNHTTTYAIEFAKQGLDWEDEFAQMAKEKQRMQELGLTTEDVSAAFNKKSNSKSEEDE